MYSHLTRRGYISHDEVFLFKTGSVLSTDNSEEAPMHDMHRKSKQQDSLCNPPGDAALSKAIRQWMRGSILIEVFCGGAPQGIQAYSCAGVKHPS